MSSKVGVIFEYPQGWMHVCHVICIGVALPGVPTYASLILFMFDSVDKENGGRKERDGRKKREKKSGVKIDFK
jgi:hypothetical protein